MTERKGDIPFKTYLDRAAVFLQRELKDYTCGIESRTSNKGVQYVSIGNKYGLFYFYRKGIYRLFDYSKPRSAGNAVASRDLKDIADWLKKELVPVWEGHEDSESP